MSIKTPEEMAEEYATLWYMSSNNERKNGGLNPYKYDGFLAGYKAAQETYKVAIEAYGNVAQQMMDEAVRIMTSAHEIAEDVLGAGKVIDPIEKLIEDKFWEQPKPKAKL